MIGKTVTKYWNNIVCVTQISRRRKRVFQDGPRREEFFHPPTEPASGPASNVSGDESPRGPQGQRRCGLTTEYPNQARPGRVVFVRLTTPALPGSLIFPGFRVDLPRHKRHGCVAVVTKSTGARNKVVVTPLESLFSRTWASQTRHFCEEGCGGGLREDRKPRGTATFRNNSGRQRGGGQTNQCQPTGTMGSPSFRSSEGPGVPARRWSGVRSSMSFTCSTPLRSRPSACTQIWSGDEFASSNVTT